MENKFRILKEAIDFIVRDESWEIDNGIFNRIRSPDALMNVCSRIPLYALEIRAKVLIVEKRTV